MSLDSLQETFMPIVVIASLAVGYIIKNTDILENRFNGYIPLILGVLGGVLGVVSKGLTLEAIVYGVISGLASTGLYEAFSNFIGGNQRKE